MTRPFRPWSGDMVRWSSVFAGGCCATSRMPRTHSRLRFWSWPAKLGPLSRRVPSAAGFIKSLTTQPLKARAQAAAKLRNEKSPSQSAPRDPLDELTGRELLAVLDEEMHR